MTGSLAHQLALSSRRTPSLYVVWEIEQAPRAYFVADSYDDEMRLRAWVRGATVADRITQTLADLLEAA